MTILYGGNPLALKLVAATIQELFDSDINDFLRSNVVVFGDIESLLGQQLERLPLLGREVVYWLALERESIQLSRLERDILYWLVVQREEVTGSRLYEDMVRPVSRQELLETLQSLRRHSLIEKGDSGFTLQPVIMEYLTERFVKKIFAEIATERPMLLRSHALIQALAKDYVRRSQIEFILKPIADSLIAPLGRRAVTQKLTGILSALRDQVSTCPRLYRRQHS